MKRAIFAAITLLGLSSLLSQGRLKMPTRPTIKGITRRRCGWLVHWLTKGIGHAHHESLFFDHDAPALQGILES